MEQPATLDWWLERAAAEFGTPCYVYFMPQIRKRGRHLREAFAQQFTISFAIKSNPNGVLLDRLRDVVDYLDISSAGEFRRALAAGWLPERMSFTGPGKTQAELLEVISGALGELVIESTREAIEANRIAARLKRRQKVLIRLSPTSIPKGFGDQMGGRPSPFGIDVEDCDEAILAIGKLEWLDVTGFHIYAGTQGLKADAAVENYASFLDIFKTVCRRHGIVPDKLIFGSGLGVPYHPSDVAIELERVGTQTVALFETLRGERRFRETKLILETGRYLVAEAGYFLTRVVSTKLSRGTCFAVCDGGMNHNLPASGHFGMALHRNYRMHKVGGGGPVERVNLVGPLCTSIDRLGCDVDLPRLNVGDIVALHNSGAYGPTASPINFISHEPPLEILVDETGMVDVSDGARTA